MKSLYLFVYDFPHKKSEDLLVECVKQGADIAGLIAAPRKEISQQASWKGFLGLPQLPPKHPRELAEQLSIPYHVCPHEDALAMSEIVGQSAIGIVGGARIIPEKTIKLFQHGVVNYHPGKIPETSGLDSFYWMLKKDADPLVTTHFIDHRVDAGHLISIQPVTLSNEDTPATVHYKLYLAQLQSHSDIVASLMRGDILPQEPLDRPGKNAPMTDDLRKEAIAKFPQWLEKRL